eukprot:CAMPEP_0114325698 /NCGR_PEP_ID=MMETSP0059-20121206/29275_1 /TAXON_ID=36894 /ORGANISM="Pyramimonas parkeae, Strain CCMP726" /LENGTH=88 /DNA_ID=CAMNT_0001454513 /DNA_START=541 /DNA_END=807 /DNA_ORIENTATION=-
MNPMMQLSQAVFWMRRSSCTMKRVLATDCAKQHTVSKHRHNSGQLCSCMRPEHGQCPAQQMYLDMSLYRARLRREYDAQQVQIVAKQQ